MRSQPTRQQIIGFRLAGHGLHDAAASPDLLDAAGRVGVQNSPPGSGALSLGARALPVEPATLDAAIASTQSLLQTWSLRGAPHLFPTRDAAVFTAGVLPPTEAAGRRFLPGVVPALDALELTLAEATDLTEAAAREALPGRALDIHELGAELAPRIGARLTKAQRAHWNAEGPHAPGQSIGEAVVHFAVRILALRGVVCIAPRRQQRAQFVLTAEFLGAELPAVPGGEARAELLSRYLRCFAPATPASFATWLGVGRADAAAWWDLLADDLVPVDTEAGQAWVLGGDLQLLATASLPDAGGRARLLPPGDPYLRTWDRATIVPASRQRQLWRTVGGPGAVLLDGEIVGLWRGRKRGAAFAVSVTEFAELAGEARERVAAEAQRVAPLRGAETAAVTFA